MISETICTLFRILRISGWTTASDLIEYTTIPPRTVYDGLAYLRRHLLIEERKNTLPKLVRLVPGAMDLPAAKEIVEVSEIFEARQRAKQHPCQGVVSGDSDVSDSRRAS